MAKNDSLSEDTIRWEEKNKSSFALSVMTKQQGGGFVIRDSHKKEKVTIQEEKRRQRLRKREKKNRDRKGEVDCKALSKNISHHHHRPRCYSVLLCMLAEQAFTSTSSFALQYHLSEWHSKFKDIWNV